MGPEPPPAASPPAAAPPPPTRPESRARITPRTARTGLVLATAVLVGSSALALWFGGGSPSVVVTDVQVFDERTCPGVGGPVLLQWHLSEVNGIPASATLGFYQDGAWVGEDGYAVDGGATVTLSHTVFGVGCGEHAFEVRVLSVARR